MPTPENSPVNYSVTLSEQDAELFENIVSCFQDTNGKSLEPSKFIEMLVRTVMDTQKNPDSDSATMMDALLTSHFPNYVDNFEAIEEERERLKSELWGLCETDKAKILTLPRLRKIKLENDRRFAELGEMLEETS